MSRMKAICRDCNYTLLLMTFEPQSHFTTLITPVGLKYKQPIGCPSAWIQSNLENILYYLHSDPAWQTTPIEERKNTCLTCPFHLLSTDLS